MAFFDLVNHHGTVFNRAPYARKCVTKGWCIMAHSADVGLYGGHYVRAVGWADSASPGFIAFRLKRDAQAAIVQALADGVLFESVPPIDDDLPKLLWA